MTCADHKAYRFRFIFLLQVLRVPTIISETSINISYLAGFSGSSSSKVISSTMSVWTYLDTCTAGSATTFSDSKARQVLHAYDVPPDPMLSTKL